MKQYIEPAVSVVDLCMEDGILGMSDVKNEVVETEEYTGKKGWNCEDWTKE